MLIAQAHVEHGTARADGERPIPELAGEIKRLPHRLLLREAQRVLGHLRLDACAHLGGGAEEAIRRRESLDPLVRALEVVVLDKKRHAALAVLEVREHGP